MLKRIEVKYKFKKGRNFNLVTPCCNRGNKDGKFVNYKELPENYGYCHSCGKTTLPPALYEDNEGQKYVWNEVVDGFVGLSNAPVPLKLTTRLTKCVRGGARKVNYIPEDIVWKKFSVSPENNLLSYLRKIYGDDKVDFVKEMYAIGTSNHGGTIFWNINKNLKVQKAKISFYDNQGKRTNRFNVPYKNEDGYYSCLFGEHLIIDGLKGIQKIVLVESEKTAIVGDIILPKYTWLAYGGINGLTADKLKALIGHRVLVVPDCSSSAIKVMEEKLIAMTDMGIDARIWDMRQGKTDEELKEHGVYNMDLEDFIRKFTSPRK